MDQNSEVHHCDCILLFCCFFHITGYQCEQHNNPADFFLDVIIENEQADDVKGT